MMNSKLSQQRFWTYHIKVVGYRLNRLDGPIRVTMSKMLRTYFGIHHRLESCEKEHTSEQPAVTCDICTLTFILFGMYLDGISRPLNGTVRFLPKVLDQSKVAPAAPSFLHIIKVHGHLTILAYILAATLDNG